MELTRTKGTNSERAPSEWPPPPLSTHWRAFFWQRPRFRSQRGGFPAAFPLGFPRMRQRQIRTEMDWSPTNGSFQVKGTTPVQIPALRFQPAGTIHEKSGFEVPARAQKFLYLVSSRSLTEGVPYVAKGVTTPHENRTTHGPTYRQSTVK